MGELPIAVVRLALEADADAVREVGLRTWPATYAEVAGPDYVTAGLAKWWSPDAVLRSITSGRCLVAEVDGLIAGMAGVGTEGATLMLWKLYVLPGHQGAGVGTALMDAVLTRAAREGCEQVRLSYVEGNERAAKFYAGKGFREVERESHGGGVPDEVWMVRGVEAWSLAPQSSTGPAVGMP